MKFFSLTTALLVAVAGSALAQNQTADAGDDADGHHHGEEHGDGPPFFFHHRHHGHRGHRFHHGHHFHHHHHHHLHHGSTLERCTILQHLTGVIDTAANATLLQEASHGNATRAAALQAHAAALQNATTPAGAFLQTLQTNATLVAACAAVFAEESSQAACHPPGQRHAAGADVDLARNASRLNATLEGNTTRIEAFQRQATQATVKLDALLNNATLMAVCKTEVPSVLESANGAPDDQSSTQAATTSRASHATTGSALSLIILFACGLVLF
ncbi:hypothetical protein SPI_07111 [Niveomyces insectorum RCEF 264]|uniref:Uncharacterized protein n=1 Tax=Niveomyces insectorum RCEF 264 TaxID=1081102 RepID=A0A167QA89_9HYPO|nr:hypothetical protein SPI_07111 [Niveomyces insectorum RCEF 264]